MPTNTDVSQWGNSRSGKGMCGLYVEWPSENGICAERSKKTDKSVLGRRVFHRGREDGSASFLWLPFQLCNQVKVSEHFLLTSVTWLLESGDETLITRCRAFLTSCWAWWNPIYPWFQLVYFVIHDDVYCSNLKFRHIRNPIADLCCGYPPGWWLLETKNSLKFIGYPQTRPLQIHTPNFI